MVGLRNSWRLIFARDPDSVLGGVIVEDPAIISSHQILEKLPAVRVKEERLTDVRSTLFLEAREAVGDPSSEDSVVAEIVEMAYDGGIATYECSRQFTSGRFGIRLNSTQQFVLIYE
ncbi:hypothetical protein WR25_25767 [Diploscapter pachys]|uniref:Uncharacterized protein n=1 Tax=Diploscapter pachys TaxID=2018661 RepID=A0A2A2J6H0_9BILA|nr:hypothetical protein WR25_25767 [Diploscapter pachys]